MNKFITREACVMKFGDFREAMVIEIDTITIPEYCTDTIMQWNTIINDVPVYIIKDKLVMEVIRRRDTLFIKGKCKADTIYRDKVILKPVINDIYRKIDGGENSNEWLECLYYGIGGLLSIVIGVLIYLLVRKNDRR